MGFGHSLFLVKEGDAKAAAAPEWEAPSVKDESAPVSGAGQKRKAPALATKGGGAKSKAKKK